MTAIQAILLFAIYTGCTCASYPKLEQCRDSCITKITDIRLCNEACVQLSNTSDSNSITAPPPVPDPPLLLSSTYFTFTLQWNDYPATKYNTSPVFYVLEVTRHQNTSNSAVILPFLTKYHKTKNRTFTIPQQFVTKTNFSFRLAVVAAQGTSNFSAPSPLYLTNDTCDRALHSGIFGTPGKHFPCPVFNLRINFTATEVMLDAPRISTTLYWDYPHDIHTNLEGQLLGLEVTLSDEFPYSREQECVRHGVSVFHSNYVVPEHPNTSESYPLPGQRDQMYFGCPYKLKLFSAFEVLSSTTKFVSEATFYIPHCIHGFCGCAVDNSLRLKEDSDYVDVHVHQSNHSIYSTTANITWRNEAWGNKIPEFFKIIIMECPNGRCPSLISSKIEISLADPTKTAHSYISANLRKGELHFVVIAAYDKSGCKLIPTEGQKFKASVPPPAMTSKPSTQVSSPTLLANQTTPDTRQTTAAITAKPSTPTRTAKPSTQVSSPTTLSNQTTPGTRQTRAASAPPPVMTAKPSNPTPTAKPRTQMSSPTPLSNPTTPDTRKTTAAHSFLCYKCPERENYTKEQCEEKQTQQECPASLKVTCFKQHTVKEDGSEIEERGCEFKEDCEKREKKCEEEVKELKIKECGVACCITDGDTPCNGGVTVSGNTIVVLLIAAACGSKRI